MTVAPSAGTANQGKVYDVDAGARGAAGPRLRGSGSGRARAPRSTAAARPVRQFGALCRVASVRPSRARVVAPRREPGGAQESAPFTRSQRARMSAAAGPFGHSTTDLRLTCAAVTEAS